jgi:uncharacterized membrane-anchored protein
MELLIELFLEVILQFFGEFLVELGWRSGKEVFRQRKVRNPWLAAIGSLLLGSIVGLASLAIIPKHFIQSELLQLVNLLMTPVLAGLAMWWIGRFRTKRNQQTIRLESFWRGYLFALGMALLRYFLCK